MMGKTLFTFDVGWSCLELGMLFSMNGGMSLSTAEVCKYLKKTHQNVQMNPTTEMEHL